MVNMKSSVNIRVDPERVYVTGFSLGCMMAHRFAMERSKLVAGLMCHAGELSMANFSTPVIMDAQRTKFGIEPMPMYVSIGDHDPWFSLAEDDFRLWAYWNGCKETKERKVRVALPNTDTKMKGFKAKKDGKGGRFLRNPKDTGGSDHAAVERVASSCRPF